MYEYGSTVILDTSNAQVYMHSANDEYIVVHENLVSYPHSWGRTSINNSDIFDVARRTSLDPVLETG